MHDNASDQGCLLRGAVGVYASCRVTDMARNLGYIWRDAAKRPLLQAKLDAAAGRVKHLATALQTRGPPQLKEVPAEKRHRLSMRGASVFR